MGLAVGNRTTSLFKNKTKSSHSYNKYLISQALETTLLNVKTTQITPSQDYVTGDLSNPNHNYAMGDILKESKNQISQSIEQTFTKEQEDHNLDCFKKYTYMTGSLVKEVVKTNQDYLTIEALNEIAKLEMGEHDVSKDSKKGRTVIAREVKVLYHNKQNYVLTKQDVQKGFYTIDGKNINLTENNVKDYTVTAQDLENGYFTYNKKDKIYFPNTSHIVGDIDKKQESFVTLNDDEFKIKTAIEITYTVDSTFSYYIQKLNQSDRDDAIKLYNDSCAEMFKEYIAPLLKNHNGEQIEDYLMYQVAHLDNRAGNPFLHIHQMVSSVGRTKDGRVFSIEMPAITEKAWHTSHDHIFKQKFIQKFTERFGNVVEAYDKDHEKIDPKNISQEIKDYRIAYDQESLLEIKDLSNVADLIKQHIDKEKKELKNSFEYEDKELKKQIKTLKLKFSDNKVNFESIARVESIKLGLDKYNKEKLIITIVDEKGNKKEIYHYKNEEPKIRSVLKEGDLVQFDLVKSLGRENHYDLLKLNQDLTDTYHLIDNLDFKLVTNEDNYRRQNNRMNTRKYEDEVWAVIKNRKEELPISVKQAKLNTTSDQLRTTMDKTVGDTIIRRGMEEMYELLTNIDPYFTLNQLMDQISFTGEHKNVKELAQSIIQDSIEKKDLIQILDPMAIAYNKELDEKKLLNPDLKLRAKKPEVVYLKADLIKKEQENIMAMRKLVVDYNKSRHIDPKVFEEKLQEFLIETEKEMGFKLGDEQIDFVRIFASNKGLSLINGSAGVGKSFTLNLAYKFMKKLYAEVKATDGKQVEPNFILIAPSGKVASDLSSAVNTKDNTDNVPAMTIDKFLIDYEQGKYEGKLSQFSNIIMDESGMVGCRNMNKLLEIQKKHGFAIRLIGDAFQLESVAVGSPFQSALEDKFLQKHFTFLKNIRRQETDSALIVAKELALTNVADKDLIDYRKKAKHIKKTFELMKTHNNIKVFDTVDEKVDYLSTSLISSDLEWKNKAVITSENNEAKLVNDRTQEFRLRLGQINVDKQFKTFKGTFYQNDRVVMKKNNTKDDYSNGDFGTITDIDEKGQVTIKLDNGKTIKPPHTMLNRMELCYSISTHLSQGMTLKGDGVKADVIDSPVNNQNLLYVMLSRGTKDTEICVVKSEMERAFASFERLPNKVRLIDLGTIHCLGDVDLSLQPLTSDEMDKAIKRDFKNAKVNVEDYSKINVDNSQIEPMKELDNPKFKVEKLNVNTGLKIHEQFDQVRTITKEEMIKERGIVLSKLFEEKLEQTIQEQIKKQKEPLSFKDFKDLQDTFVKKFQGFKDSVSKKVKTALKKQKEKVQEAFGFLVTKKPRDAELDFYVENYTQNYYNYLPEVHNLQNNIKFNNGMDYDSPSKMDNKDEDLRVNAGLVTSELKDNIKLANPTQHKNNEIELVVKNQINIETSKAYTQADLERLKRQNQNIKF